MAALQGDYARAIANYEKVAAQAVNNNLMRYSVKEYFLKAGICQMLTGDSQAAPHAIERYAEMDPSFAQTREFHLLRDLVAAVAEQDQELFTDKLLAYDQMSRLDKWKTELCLRIKNMIESTAEDQFA